MDPAQLHGLKVAILFVGETDDGSDDCAVMAGPATWDGGNLWINYGDPDHQFPLPEEAWPGLQPVPRDVRDIFQDAQFYTSIAVGNLPEDADYSQLMLTGLQWPAEEE